MHGMGEVRKGEALGCELVLRDPAGEGDRLERSRSCRRLRHLQLAESAAMFVDPMVVDELFRSWTPTTPAPWPGSTSPNAIWFCREELPPVGVPGPDAPHAVPNCEDHACRPGGFFAFLGKRKIGEFDAVCGYLRVRRAHLRRIPARTVERRQWRRGAPKGQAGRSGDDARSSP